MHARFVTSILAALGGGFVVVVSQAFASGTTAWLAFAIGIALLVLAAVPAAFAERGLTGLALDGAGGVLAIWTIIASLVFHGDTVRWLSFGEGAGFVALAVLGLTLNQVRLAHLAHAAAPQPASAPLEAPRPSAIAA